MEEDARFHFSLQVLRLSFMRLFPFALLQALWLARVGASRTSLSRRPAAKSFVAAAVSAPSSSDSVSLANVEDIRYAITTMVNGVPFNLLVDTGSADLWVIEPSDSRAASFTYDSTNSQPFVLVYGGGNITGVTASASVQIGDFSISNQAIGVIPPSGVHVADVLELGLDGLVGTAFGLNNNPFDESFLVAELGPVAGQPFLFNIFDSMPVENNFVGMSLSRTDDLEGSADASFTVNSLDPLHAAAVSSAAPQAVFPGIDANGRWSVLVDAIYVGTTQIPLGDSVIHGTPAGKLVVMMDSGTPTSSIPTALWYALYANIPGTTVGDIDGAPVFTIPCESTTIMTVVIGGVQFPIHPLDLSNIATGPSADVGLGDNSVCLSALNAGPADPGDIDVIFGDSFMRNFYSVFNYGDSPSSPGSDASIQFVSLTDAASAQSDVAAVRMQAFANGTYPPELTTTLSGFVPAIPGVFPSFLNPDGSDGSAAGALSGSLASGSTETSGSSKYVTVIISLLAANLLVVLALLVLGIMTYRRTASKAREAKYQPLQLPKKLALQGELDDSEGLVDGRYSD
uniref:Peptidase A1 domain-containing protein n=1 Tax=Mycena chlorophos TaxID=658473 RepID=A0ABQ0LMQ9_MYCCL|nr:predicted protein [Mycena chlorophos]